MNRTTEPAPAPAEPSPARPSLPRRVLTALARTAIGLAIWAAIIFAVALFVIPGKPKISRPPASSRSTVAITPDSFTNVEKCSSCHWDLFKQWSGTMHSLANSDPFYAGLYDLANADTGGKAEEYCAASMCHTPVGFLRGENPFPHDRLSPIAQVGVFCDFCHTVVRRRGIGDAAYTVSPGPVKRGPYKNAESPYHQTAYSKLHRNSQFCGMCHEVSHPITGLKLETTYSEWARGPYARPGKAHRECQDCHMKPYAGRASSIGIRRPAVFSHYFGGANAFITGTLGESDRARTAERHLESAARVGVAALTRARSRVNLAVRVTNTGAGHSIPTGITEVRQMWLHIVVTSGGKKVYTSGTLSPGGVLDPQAHLFHTVLGDRNGQPVTKVWRAVRVLNDHRVEAGKSVVERYSFNVPRATGRLRVSATLMYRSAPQDLVDLVVGGRKKMKVPAVEMARAVARL